MTDYDLKVNRDKAYKRAQKMLMLFDEKNFGPIMNSVEPVQNEGAFKTACKNAGLAASEITWLWTYLKQCKKAVYDPIPEAATTGW